MPAFLDRAKAYAANMHSENWGGGCGILGDLVVLSAVDIESLIASVTFVIVDLKLLRHGEKSKFYSAGYALIGAGDLLMCFSNATAGNAALQYSLAAFATTFAIAGLRYPLERLSIAVRDSKPALGNKIQKIADQIQPVVGVVAIIQHIPVLVYAGIGHNKTMFIAQSFWVAQDVLMGRVQTVVKNCTQKVRDLFMRPKL